MLIELEEERGGTVGVVALGAVVKVYVGLTGSILAAVIIDLVLVTEG